MEIMKYGLGSHATYLSVSWTKAHAVPDSIETNVAAAGGVQALTALTFFTEAYNVKQGDIILIHTVAGGLAFTHDSACEASGGHRYRYHIDERKGRIC